jgi:glyoxylate/hydroxypyruvate reductase A
MICAMNIVVAHNEPGSGRAWQQALAAHLPQAHISIDAGTPDGTALEPSGSTPGAAQLAVGWKPPADFFARHPSLQAFFSCGAGVDHLLAHPGLPATLPIYRLEDAGMGACMADYCLHALLHIAGRQDAYALQQAQQRWGEHMGLTRAELPVGIVGMGVLGEQVARTLKAQGFTVRGFTRTPRTVSGIEMLSGPAQWSAFLAASRVLILLAPNTAQTRDLIDHTALAALASGAWLINIARGALVVDDALLGALDRGHLAGAVLDVFREEPLPPAHPFWHHPRIRITPHVSGPTLLAPSSEQVAAKIALLAHGGAPTGRVDPHRGY